MVFPVSFQVFHKTSNDCGTNCPTFLFFSRTFVPLFLSPAEYHIRILLGLLKFFLPIPQSAVLLILLLAFLDECFPFSVESLDRGKLRPFRQRIKGLLCCLMQLQLRPVSLVEICFLSLRQTLILQINLMTLAVVKDMLL